LGDYRILREVGRGGMGIVYEAEQESLGRHVALKVLSAQAVRDPTQLQRFAREARAAARLHYTNIVPVFGVGQDQGLSYYVMQFIPGLGLDAVLAELQPLRGAASEAAAAPASEPRPSAPTGAGAAAQLARSLITGRRPGGRHPVLGLSPRAGAAGASVSGVLRPRGFVVAALVRPGQALGGLGLGLGAAICPQRGPDRRAGGRGAGVCASAGDRAPRHQALEPEYWTGRAPSG
jgi:hypothetical protein